MTTGPRCARCALRPELCICSMLPRVNTKTRVSLVMHKMESLRSSNTGRLAMACLQNAETFLFGNDLPALPDLVWPPGARPVVLFPIANAPPVTKFAGDDLCLIVLDGSWRQANRFRKRYAAQNIPFVQVPPGPPSAYALRVEPHDKSLCTLEAIARSLQALEGGDVERELMRALAMFQDRTLWLRGYKAKEDVLGGIPEGALRHRSYRGTPGNEPGNEPGGGPSDPP
jgi:DTW domain-containing protein